MITYAAYDGPQVLVRGSEIVEIYREAFRAPPYSKPDAEVAEFQASLPHHVHREGFTFLAALAGDRLVGFAYGNTALPGQGWHDHVREAMPGALYTAWLPGRFQLAEIAVAPDFQRQGIGGRLHDHLIGGVPHDRAVLTTMTADTPASRLYRRRGWVVLLQGHYFPGVDRPYSILGLDLGARTPVEEMRGHDGAT